MAQFFFQWCGSRWFSGAFWRELLRRSFRALNSLVQFSWAALIIDLGKRATTTNKIASINYYIWWCTTTLFQSATAFGGSVHDPPFHECWSPEAALLVARNNERYWEKWDSQIGQNVNHYPMPTQRCYQVHCSNLTLIRYQAMQNWIKMHSKYVIGWFFKRLGWKL